MTRLLILLVSLLSLSCVDSFNPIAEGRRPYVVFGLLNTGVDTQLVRVHTTSSPSIAEPGYPTQPGTVVTLSGPEGLLSFRDSLVVGASSASSGRVFFYPAFVPSRGATYQLTVHTPDGDASASSVVPGSCTIYSSSYFILQDPYHYPKSELITATVPLAPQAYGFLIRLVVEYEEFAAGAWVPGYIEVPLAYRSISDDYLTIEGVYPRPNRRTTSIVSQGQQPRESMIFSNAEYLQTLKVLFGRVTVAIRTTRAMFIVSQTDRNFFTYYSLANHFQDPNSIRVDQPDFSNISGASGFFGALTSDTLAFTIPPDLRPPS